MTDKKTGPTSRSRAGAEGAGARRTRSGAGASTKATTVAAASSGPAPETKAGKDSAPPAEGGKPRPRRGIIGPSGILNILFLLVFLSGSIAYLVFEVKSKRQSQSEREQFLNARFETLETAVESLREGNERLYTRLARLDEQNATMLNNFSRLHQQRDGSTAWRLEEVKQLLLSASRQLSLHDDPQVARVALQAADRRLVEIGDPALLPVRQQLIADLNRLQALQLPDYIGLALMLDELATQVEQFPLRRVTTTPAPAPATDPALPEGAWQRFAAAVWGELKGLVTLSRTPGDGGVILPQESYFLYHNLRLQLEAARLAVLLRDQAQLRASTQAASSWLTRYFDAAAPPVAAALRALRDAAAQELQPAIPSVDASLRALAAYTMEQQGSAADVGADF